ncbi:MAG: DUF6691 family protein [Bacteroidota bacterium]
MKSLFYLFIGTLFGIIMTKSEAVSWFRIQEMFRFESFHMYGIIGTAVLSGALLISLAKRYQWTTFDGREWSLKAKDKTITRYLLGGTIFGLGWALTGACPGPMFTLVGHGLWSMVLVIASATLGTFVYGLVRKHLPH